MSKEPWCIVKSLKAVCMYILKSLAMYIKIHDVCIVKSPKRLVPEETEIVVKRRLNVPYVYILKKG